MLLNTNFAQNRRKILKGKITTLTYPYTYGFIEFEKVS